MKILSTATIQKKADKIFSEYIRIRDSDKNGFIRCCACGRMVYWKDADNSHFVSRQYLRTRYSDKNCHASCRQCNRFLEGNKDGYAQFLIEKYGDGIIKELNKDKMIPFVALNYEKLIEEIKKKRILLNEEK